MVFYTWTMVVEFPPFEVGGLSSRVLHLYTLGFIPFEGHAESEEEQYDFVKVIVGRDT